MKHVSGLLTAAYRPITSTSPSSRFVGINQTVSYGSTELLSAAGITDTGTTLILLASDAFEAHKRATGHWWCH